MAMIDKLLECLPIVSCQEATRLVSLQMERRLHFKEWLDLKLHLGVCDLCVRFKKQIQGLSHTLRHYHQQLCADTPLPDASKKRIKQLIH